MFLGVARSRESVRDLAAQIEETRAGARVPRAGGRAARRALLVELDAALQALALRANNASMRRRVLQLAGALAPKRLPP